MFYEGAIPHETQKEGAYKDRQNKYEKLDECVRLSTRLGNFLDHLLQVNIFFYITYI
jgi:hypothetical protein